MKKKSYPNLLISLSLSLLVIFFKIIEGPLWWGFVLPVMIFGALISFRKYNIPFFSIGFLSGFIVWLVSNLYFNFAYNGYLLYRAGIGWGVLALMTSGFIGGLLTGLAFYTGKHMVFGKKKA